MRCARSSVHLVPAPASSGAQPIASPRNQWLERAGVVAVKETFDVETENPPELQRAGWQAVLDNFGRYLEAKG